MDKNQTPIIGSKNLTAAQKREPTKRGLKFEANGDGTCTLVGTGLFLEEDVMIPAIHKGMTVTEIASEAFKKCEKITKMIIPGTVTSIGSFAFQACPNLTSVIIAPGVKSIGNWAFYNCTNLTSITIPDSVRRIGIETFRGCSGLTSIEIPDSVTSIGD